jgi:V8-like Glu-specific endopeptidase
MSDAALRPLLEKAILAEPRLAAEAIEAIQMGSEEKQLTFAGMKAGAEAFDERHEAFIVERLAKRKLLRAFTLAMAARGAALPDGWEAALALVVEERKVALDAQEVAPGTGPAVAPLPPLPAAPAAPVLSVEDDEDEEAPGGQGRAAERARTAISEDALQQLLRVVRSTRCRIRVGGKAAGSGLLVGPSTVLTAWHVLKDAAGSSTARIDVDFADGSHVPAVLPLRFESRCGDRELKGQFPQNDNEVADAHDVALLQLRRPVGAALGRVALAGPDLQLRTRDSMFLVHYPEGDYGGISPGIFCKLRNLSARWGHSVSTDGGSSGGGCFNTSQVLVGIHQGRTPDGKYKVASGRLVPASRFPAGLREVIAQDEAPPRVWSLDGTAHGPLVLGRQGFFEAFSAASRASGRIRGVRIRRVDAGADTSGLPFSYMMLEYLVARGVDLRALRIGFEGDIPDFTDEVVRRAALAGFATEPVAPAQGVDIGQTTMEAAVSDRARRAATLIDAAAKKACVRLWIFFEHPSTVFGDSMRVAFEAFVDQALRLDNLRLVVAGFEAVTVPGPEFRFPTDANLDGPPGFLTEFLQGFRRADVEHLFNVAAADLGVTVDTISIPDLTDRVLDGLAPSAGVYNAADAKAVIEKLRPELAWLARKRPVNGLADGH